MIGRQEPTFEVVGEWQETNGGEAVALFESYGFHFDYAQRREMDIYLARIDGKPAAVTVGLSIPRQNGKSYAARWYAIWCAAILGLVVLYSAHNGDTITEFFTMVTSIFEDEENYPDFAEMLDGAPYRQPGKESIRFKSGGRIRFMTRTNNKSRSSTCDVMVMDEAQELTDAQLNAILPVVSAGPHGMPQIIYIGTPPDTTCPGTVFRRMHDRAHSDNPGKAWWMEWAVDSVPPEDATKQQLMELAYMTNPALGVRITEGAVENEIDSMSRDGFARERLGWWDMNSNGVEHVIDAEAWAGQMVSRLTYSNEDVELSGDAAVVGVRVWPPRAGEIVSKASEGMSTFFHNQGVRDGEPLSEDLQEDVIRTFETTTESAPVEERTLDVVLTRSDDGFVVDERALEKDLLNAFGAVA